MLIGRQPHKTEAGKAIEQQHLNSQHRPHLQNLWKKLRPKRTKPPSTPRNMRFCRQKRRRQNHHHRRITWATETHKRQSHRLRLRLLERQLQNPQQTRRNARNQRLPRWLQQPTLYVFTSTQWRFQHEGMHLVWWESHLPHRTDKENQWFLKKQPPPKPILWRSAKHHNHIKKKNSKSYNSFFS